MLHKVFGSTSIAMSTVLSVFMAGLGLGAWLGGKYAERLKRPLLVYAAAEVGVAIWALLIPFMVGTEGWLADVNSWLRVSFGAESGTFMIARFVCVVPILLVPTTLMGASLPLLSRHFVATSQSPDQVSQEVGRLYALNTFGAVFGVFLGGFVFMPLKGVTFANIAAAGMNLALALLLFAFAPRGAITKVSDASTPATAEPVLTRQERIAKWAAFFAFAVSGAAALCSEVVWSRALAMTIGSSIYSFHLMLMTFLVGIAGGSALASALLSAQGRALRYVAVFAFVAGAVTAAPWAVRYGVAGVIAVMGLNLLLIVGAAMLNIVGNRARSLDRKSLAPPDENTHVGPAIMMLSAPALISVLSILVFRHLLPATDSLTDKALAQSSLPEIACSVVCVASLLFVLILLARKYPIWMLCFTQLCVAAATFVSYVWQDEIPYTFALLVSTLSSFKDNVAAVQALMFVTAGLCTLPATLGMGAMWPIALRAWTRGGAHVGRDVGVLYAGNTVGSIIGAWLPGFVLMPWIGPERTIVIGIWTNMLVGLVLLIVGSSSNTPAEGSTKTPIWQTLSSYTLSPLIPALATLLFIGAFRDGSGHLPGEGSLRWNLAQMSLGVFRLSNVKDMLDRESWGEPDEIPFYKDGLSSTVSVERWQNHLALKNNGKVDASNGADMPTQIMVAGFPLMLHPTGGKNAEVAIVGFGSGVTVGTTLKFPVKSVEVIELERFVIEASRLFADVNFLKYPLKTFPFVQMPRLSVINDDGRNYLSATRKQYDVIMSEPSNPWITGVSDLFTTDHFHATKQRLKPGGVYCQWVQLYEMSPANIKTIYRTFASQFKYVMVFSADAVSSDTVLIGSDSPLRLDFGHVQEILNDPQVKTELARAEIFRPQDAFARLLIASRSEVMAYSQIERLRSKDGWRDNSKSSNQAPCELPNCERSPATLNTDDNAHIEFAAPRDLIGFEQYEGYIYDEIYANDWPYGKPMSLLANYGQGDDAARNLAELSLSLASNGRNLAAAELAQKSRELGTAPETVVAFEVVSRLLSRDGEPALTVAPPVAPESATEAERARLELAFTTVKRLVDDSSYKSALEVMESIETRLLRACGSEVRYLYAYLLYKSDDFDQSRTELEAITERDPAFSGRHPEFDYFLGRAYAEEFEYTKSVRRMRSFVEARLAANPEQAPSGVEPPK